MAYAAVISLQLAMRDLVSISKSKKLISRSDMIFIDDQFDYLDSFLNTIAYLPSNKIAAAAASERRVKDAARRLHDLIDSQVSDQLLLSESTSMDGDEITRFTLLFSQQLPILEQELSSFLTALNTTQDQQLQQRYCTTLSSSDYNTGKQQNLVGLDEQIKILKEWLLDSNTYLACESLVGMTGIGKTTLVKRVYNDPDVEKEFELRLFVHIGPHCNQFEETVLLVLNQLGVVPSDKLLEENKDYLRQQLSEALSSTKYLIVLEDVWNNDIVLTHQLKHMGFPDKEVGSRVIITSHILSTYDDILLPLLNEEDSWKLLYQTAFTIEENCSSELNKCDRELEKMGKKIARNCDGLPAAIIQVGENLRGKSVQEWKALSENEDPLVITRDDDTPLSKALYFSYMMLPQFLKVIFLYMGVFPKNYGISRSMLIKLWISEGFLDTKWEMLEAEEVAGEYLDQLVGQSVVLSEKMASSSSEKTKKCRLHFTFRSLCVNEAKSEKIFHILKKYTDCTPENLRSQQRLCVHSNVVLAFREVYEWMESVPNARSLLCFGPKQQYPIVLPLFLRLLKVLDALAIRFFEFPHQVLALFHLRYLTITCDRELPNSISRLENLEVLVLGRHHNIKLSNGPIYLPIDIWNMHKLKQLYCMGFDLPTPPTDDPHLVLEKLLTLSGVSAHSCTMDVLSRIPMLKRVAVQIESAHDSTETFSFFGHFTSRYQDFESFKCVVINPNLRSQVIPCAPSFPVNIAKICLSGCGFPWKKIGVLAALTQLRVLKLQWSAFCGPEWKSSEREFPWLRFLLLEDLDIEHWKFDGVLFPLLNHVIFRHCYKLKNIPDQLRYTDVLEVDDCGVAFVEKMRNWKNTSPAETKIHSSADL